VLVVHPRDDPAALDGTPIVDVKPVLSPAFDR